MSGSAAARALAETNAAVLGARRACLAMFEFVVMGVMGWLARRWRIVGCGAPAILSPCFIVSPRPTVADVSFIAFGRDGRVALLGSYAGAFELYLSAHDGKDWRTSAPPVSLEFAIANGTELWAAYAGFLDGCEGIIASSLDDGTTWSSTAVTGNACTQHTVPERFINRPDDPPLLVTLDHQLWRPIPDRPMAAYQKIGVPPSAVRPQDTRVIGGMATATSIYLTMQRGGRTLVALSTDGAATWNTVELTNAARTWVSPIVCDEELCALACVHDHSTRILRTKTGENVWTPVITLDRAHTPELYAPTEPEFEPLEFEASAITLAPDGIWLVGPLWESAHRAPDHADTRRRSRVVRIRRDHSLTVMPRAVEATIIQWAPDGHVWIAGDGGAYRLEKSSWRRMWPPTE